MNNFSGASRDFVEETRFRLTRGQEILGALLVISVLIFGISTVTSSRNSISQARLLSDAEAPSASIIFTQRETLVYTARYSQWLAGQVDRRTVQIARALLAQRLSVIDAAGNAIGERLSSHFLESIKLSDSFLASTSPGIINAADQKRLRVISQPAIEAILLNSRQLTEAYQHAVDRQIRSQVVARERVARINLALLIWIGLLFVALLVWAGSTTRRQYKRGRDAIHEEKRVLNALHEELLGTQKNLADMQTLSEVKNEFISTINHELRTPLTSIIGYVGLIRKRVEKESPILEISHLVDTLDRNALALMDLVESMLSISRLDSENYSLKLSKVDLALNVESILFILEPQIAAKKISVNFHTEPDQFIIEGNNSQISQIFMNLLTNAIKFSPDSSEITIDFRDEKLADKAAEVVVRVIDQGMGIPAEDIPQLFTRFFRARNAVSDQVQGTGLGLAIVQKILEAHGGTIHVQSELGAGTTMEMRFPQALSQVDEMVAARRSQVLDRSIATMNSASVPDVAAAAHETGGAIGFYTYESEGEKILEISRVVAKLPESAIDEIENYRREILMILEKAKHDLGEVQ